MDYVVRPGDTLGRIASIQLGDVQRWQEIAALNSLRPPYTLLIGQRLGLPAATSGGQYRVINPVTVAEPPPLDNVGASWMYARAFLFVLSDEVLPSGKVVRKVGIPTGMETAAEVMAMKPEVFGIKPQVPGSPLSIGEHALGNNASRFTSASTLPGGAPNMSGRPVFIDVAKAKGAGVVFHSSEAIVADLEHLAQRQPNLRYRVDVLKRAILEVEREVLLEGNVPRTAVKSLEAMQATRVLRYVQTVGMLLTAYDIGNATIKSVRTESAAPVAAEGIRQAGGWAAAWAGAKIGGAAGAALGIETGPGAILFGAAGAMIFGAAGYFGFDWVADHVDEN